jgi:pimeloyl-ACP methyl ester carboxylesterase
MPAAPDPIALARRRDEARGVTQLAFDELGRAVRGIAGLHRSIAERAFAASGPGGAPARAMHDAISTGVYGAMRGGTRLVGRGAARAVSARSTGTELSTSAAGAGLLGVVNGLIGDELEREGSELQQPLAMRVDGEAVGVDRASIAMAFPAAAPRLVVFLHGLMETEFAWRLGAGEEGRTYGSRLADELDLTPVYVRYNSGRHVSENGRALADVLEQVVAAWPVEVEQVALVGHSMGGLVARSACHLASQEGADWVTRVRHVVSLGSPHMGAPLAQGVHLASAALDLLPETRPFAGLLRRRSAGIRDLRHGSLVEEDWHDRDPNALRAAACQEVPLLEGATHCFVAASITRSPRHPLGRLIGDALVLSSSASGRSRTRRIPFRDEDGLELGGMHHLALLNHPQVYDRLREWLAAPPAV